MNRKYFIKTASLATILSMTGLTLQSCSSDSEDIDPNNGNDDNNGGGTGGNQSSTISFSVEDSPFNALQQNQGWVLHPQNDILLVNVGGTISAFTSVCTHSGCSRDWVYNQVFTCRCHGSQFDTNGSVVTGPASSPLRILTVARDGNTVTVTF